MRRFARHLKLLLKAVFCGGLVVAIMLISLHYYQPRRPWLQAEHVVTQWLDAGCAPVLGVGGQCSYERFGIHVRQDGVSYVAYVVALRSPRAGAEAVVMPYTFTVSAGGEITAID